MKRLLITLLLISPFSFADWGDVYYCQMTTNTVTSPEGKKTDYSPQKFQFKLDKTKNAMVFGKSGIFEDMVIELRERMSYPKAELWHADDLYGALHFGAGRLLYSHTTFQGLTAISADCDKF